MTRSKWRTTSSTRCPSRAKLNVSRSTKAGRAIEASVHTAISSDEVYSQISAQVTALDSAQVLLVAAGVHSILEHRVGRPSFDLRPDNFLPKVPRPNPFPNPSFLCRNVPLIKLLRVIILQIQRFRANQRPVLIFLHSLHKKIWNPERSEQIPGLGSSHLHDWYAAAKSQKYPDATVLDTSQCYPCAAYPDLRSEQSR